MRSEKKENQEVTILHETKLCAMAGSPIFKVLNKYRVVPKNKFQEKLY